MTPTPLKTYAMERINQLCQDCGPTLPLARNLYDIVMNQVEQPLIETVLKHLNGNKVLTAKVLGINRNTLHKRLLTYNQKDTP